VSWVVFVGWSLVGLCLWFRYPVGLVILFPHNCGHVFE